MSARSYTTEALVSAIRLRAMLKSTDDGVTFPTDSDIIALINAELNAMLVPWLLNARQGHLLTHNDLTLTAGDSNYSIPSRAVASDISRLVLVDSSGNPGPELVEADLEVAVQSASSTRGTPSRYYFEGNAIVLVPTPADSTYRLRVYYPLRPSQVVPTTSVATITALTQVGSNYTVGYSSAPGTFTTSVLYEVIGQSAPFDLSESLGAPSSINSTTATFAGTLPSYISVGDSLCMADTANYVSRVPADVTFGMFAQWVAYKICEIRRDEPGMKALGTGFKAAEKSAREYLSNRDRLTHRKISNASNRYGRRYVR